MSGAVGLPREYKANEKRGAGQQGPQEAGDGKEQVHDGLQHTHALMGIRHSSEAQGIALDN